MFISRMHVIFILLTYGHILLITTTFIAVSENASIMDLES